jgi:hypothetical protein
VGPSCGAAGDAIATCPTTDSTGGDPTADAAKYPCPPTKTQLAAGDKCSLAFGDLGGKQGSVDISFVPDPTPSAPATTASSTSSSGTGGTGTTAAGSTAASTAAKASSLAFTGAGPDTWYMLLAGVLLLDLGFLVLTLYYRPRELMQMMRRGVSRTFGGS